MERVALRPCPRSTCPDDAVACYFFGHLIGCFLIEQGIEVVEALGRRGMIAVVHVYVLSEVGLDAFNAHIKQGLQERVLIPVGGFIVGEVDGAGIIESREVGGFGGFVGGNTAKY